MCRQETAENPYCTFEYLWFSVHVESHPVNDVTNCPFKAKSIIEYNKSVQYVDKSQGVVACDVVGCHIFSEIGTVKVIHIPGIVKEQTGGSNQVPDLCRKEALTLYDHISRAFYDQFKGKPRLVEMLEMKVRKYRSAVVIKHTVSHVIIEAMVPELAGFLSELEL